jgi:hypothetical protein
MKWAIAHLPPPWLRHWYKRSMFIKEESTMIREEDMTLKRIQKEAEYQQRKEKQY